MNETFLHNQSKLAICYGRLGRADDEIRVCRFILRSYQEAAGPGHEETIGAAVNLGIALTNDRQYAAARKVLREATDAAERTLGPNDLYTFNSKSSLAYAIYHDPTTTRSGLMEAETLLQGTLLRRRRTLGPTHPFTLEDQKHLYNVRVMLQYPDTPLSK